MPHHAHHAAVYVPDSLDNSILGNRPGHEWGSHLHGAKIMKAIHFYALAINGDTLPGSHMAGNFFEPVPEVVQNHLHSAADPENGQILLLGEIQKRGFSLVPFWSIAAADRQI